MNSRNIIYGKWNRNVITVERNIRNQTLAIKYFIVTLGIQKFPLLTYQPVFPILFCGFAVKTHKNQLACFTSNNFDRSEQAISIHPGGYAAGFVNYRR